MKGILVLALVSVGCANMTERIVHDAMKGLVWQADYVPKTGGDPRALAALYAHLTQELGIDVEYLPKDNEVLRGAFGISYAAGNHRFIKLRQDLSVNGSIEVLAHEAAHLYQPPYLSKSQGDVFAEIVSAHVAAKLGVPDTRATAANWLRQHKPSLRMALDLQNEIAHVTEKLLPEFTASRSH
jgi:hypothetical protein